MLTDSALNELFETVEDVPPFRRIDFKSSQEEDRTTIRYQHDKNCYFIVLNDHERPGTGVRVAAVPGTWLKESEHSCDTFRGLTHEFGNWLNRILKEIRAKPVNRMVFEQQEQLRKLAEEMSQKWNIEDEKAQFTPEEVSEIVKRLDQIEQQFSEHIRGTAEGEVDIDEKIEALEGEIAFLKDTLHTMNREGWFSTFASRLLTWANEPGNQQLLKQGVKLLLPSGDSSLDSDLES